MLWHSVLVIHTWCLLVHTVCDKRTQVLAMQRPLDLLVNNAGRFLDAPFELTEDGFEQVGRQLWRKVFLPSASWVRPASAGVNTPFERTEDGFEQVGVFEMIPSQILKTQAGWGVAVGAPFALTEDGFEHVCGCVCSKCNVLCMPSTSAHATRTQARTHTPTHYRPTLSTFGATPT